MPKSNINDKTSGGVNMAVKRNKRKSSVKKTKFSRKVSRKMLQLADEKIREIAKKRGVKLD